MIRKILVTTMAGAGSGAGVALSETVIKHVTKRRADHAFDCLTFGGIVDSTSTVGRVEINPGITRVVTKCYKER